jgi:DNA-binding HxlR family transcriptional regulator
MRSYGQYCSIARALDVVGDRWTLLIVRELLSRGACRFTDLKAGLPGVATNLLSARLKELEQAGLVAREDAPPPVATALYRMTDDGAALEPVLAALGRWGLRYMTDERADDSFRVQWLAYAPVLLTTDGEPAQPPATIQVVADGEEAVIEIGGGRVSSRIGRVDDPDLVLEGPPRAVLGVLTGKVDLKRAAAIGLRARGRRDVLGRLRPLADGEPAARDGAGT